MLEYSVYSVISPESCASILWANPKHAENAANSLKLDPQMALKLSIIDSIVPEPAGGAHKNPTEMFQVIQDFLDKEIKKLTRMKADTLLNKRYSKFREMGNQTISDHFESQKD
jgi:acetyl-CoA carboxylase carboxyl transferase subunit alpha